jgi:hypothetical protein
MTDCLDAMTVGVQHERAIVIGVIVRPKPGRAVVAPPMRKRRRVKGVDRGAVGSAKADMRAGYRCPHLGFAGDREFHTGRSGRGTIIGTAALAEINDTHEPKRTQYGVVKAPTAVDVGDTE